MQIDLPNGVVKWLAVGEHGMSSQFIVAHLCCFDTRGSLFGRPHGPDHPIDPDDLRRCRLLTEVFAPELRDRIEQMRTASESWARLVDAWPSLCSAMDREMPQWREPQGYGSAPLTYYMIAATLDGRKP